MQPDSNGWFLAQGNVGVYEHYNANLSQYYWQLLFYLGWVENLGVLEGSDVSKVQSLSS